MQSDRVWVGDKLSFELAGDTLTCSLHEDNEERTVVMQKMYSFQTLPRDAQFLFEEMRQLWQYIKKLSESEDNCITVSDRGEVSMTVEIGVAERRLKRKCVFALQKAVSSSEEVNLLKNRLDCYGRQLQQLRGLVQEVQRDNAELKLIIRGLSEVKVEEHETKDTKERKNDKKNIKIDNSLKKPKEQIVKKQQTQDKSKISPQQVSSDKPTALPFAIDGQCMYYTKFAISGQQITSLHQDYYQLYFRDPLPLDGHFQLRIKMIGKNHCSFGVFCSSQKNNQYSFQNNKSICFYSYHQGNFQGIYNRGKYLPLTWKIEQGATATIAINMTDRTVSFWLEGGEDEAQVDLSPLFSEDQDLFFFIEMYEKGNCVQFL